MSSFKWLFLQPKSCAINGHCPHESFTGAKSTTKQHAPAVNDKPLVLLTDTSLLTECVPGFSKVFHINFVYGGNKRVLIYGACLSNRFMYSCGLHEMEGLQL